MESGYLTLQTIFKIVKNDPHPETYLYSAREIILSQFQNWDTIQQHLQLLSREGLDAAGLNHINSDHVREMDSVKYIDQLREVGKKTSEQISMDHFGLFV